MFWAEMWKISVFFIWRFSVLWGEIFYIFEKACFRNDALALYICDFRKFDAKLIKTQNFPTNLLITPPLAYFIPSTYMNFRMPASQWSLLSLISFTDRFQSRKVRSLESKRKPSDTSPEDETNASPFAFGNPAMPRIPPKTKKKKPSG